jgi:low affinity Fe/Cu permease
LIYSQDQSLYEQFTGKDNCRVLVHEATGDEVLLIFFSDVAITDRRGYTSPSTDVEHIEKSFKFHSTKHTVKPTTFSVENLLNKSDMVVFVGCRGTTLIDTFVESNVLNNSHCGVRCMSDYEEKVMNLEEGDDEEKLFRCALVVDPGSIDVAIEIIKLKPEKIASVVCDTVGLVTREVITLMSLCHSKNIMCVRKLHRYGTFNLGVVDRAEQATDCPDSGNGVITMTNDTVVGEWSYVIFVDPRMVQLSKLVIGLEMAIEVWTITIVHDARDDLVVNHYQYKFYPILQTEGFIRLCQMTTGYTIHTVLTVITPFPSVAAMLFDSGIFATCDTAVALEYNVKVTTLFNKAVKAARMKHVERVVQAKGDAYNHVVGIEKRTRAINNELIDTVNKKKHTKHLCAIFNELKMN